MVRQLTGLTAGVLVSLLLVAAVRGDDWPQWRGPGRDGVWRETGILEKIPSSGLKVLWRARVKNGYSGPVVAQGRVFITDRNPKLEVERVLCFDAATGQPLWQHEYPCPYADMEYGNGPRASPTVHDGRVYTLGTKGHVFCLDAATGKVVWGKDLVKEHDARAPQYGMSAAPLVEGDVVIVIAGGRPDATVMAFDRHTGQVLWKALADRPAYSAPIALTAGGARQVIVWTADSIASFEPTTGSTHWQIPWKATFDPAQMVAAPVLHRDFLLFLAGWDRGSKMLKLDASTPTVSVHWETKRKPTTTFSTPVFQDEGHFYMIESDGSLCCVDTANGKELWTTRDATSARFGNAHLTPNGNRIFLFNEKGQLIVARLTPQGYEELGRSLLVEPTAGFRAGNLVAWAHPAYADKCVFARNDRELVCASLAAEPLTDTNTPNPMPAVLSRPLPGSDSPDASLALALAIAPGGQTVALGSGWGAVKLLDLSSGEARPSPKPHNDWVCSVAFSPDGKLLVSVGGSEFKPARNGNQTSAEVRVWDPTTGTALGQLVGHTSKVFSVVFSPDGKTLATGSADQTVRLWDVATMKERAVLSGHTDAVRSVAFSPDGKTLVSGGWEGAVKLWDTVTGKEVAGFKAHDEEILTVAISPDGQTLATGSADWTVRLWDLPTGKARATFNGHHGGVYSLAFTSDGKTLVTGSGDETIKLWDVATGTQRVTLRGHRSGVSALALSPDNKTLVSAGLDDAVRLWDLTGQK